ncbi:MAG: sulfurtransferase [Propionivibrio sp.]|nr:sulfurtransferase [Propionivibrio sp.]
MNFSTLLSTEVLAAHLNDPDWRIFDCRHRLSDVEFGAQAYAEGHLPGAFFLHLDRDLSAPMNGRNGRHPLPDAQLLASKLGAAGVSRQSQVVAYDDDGGMIAARLWWLLRWLGHDRVALLDGGIGQWVREGRVLTSERSKPVPARFEVERRDWVVSSDEVLASLDRRELCLVDARAPDRFRGENETLDPVGGHIPGARNRFFRDNLDAEGCFRPAPELRREFLALLAGTEPAQSVMQCGSGVTACHNLLAMEIAGLNGAKLHAGSWSEWCADPARPVAR